MDTDHYDSFTEDDRISKDDVSILSAYHAYLTSFDEEPSLYEFQTYYDDLVEQGLAPKLHSQIKSLPQKNISNYTGNETITSEDVTILDSYQSFLVGNENKKAKDISEFKSYHDAFMVLKNKKTRLDSEIVKLPKFKEKNNTKKVELKKRRTTNLLECGTLEFENLERKGFLYNNREYLGATFGNGNCGKGNKQTFLPLSDKQIKKAIEYRENDFLVYDHETNQYQFKYNKSVSLLDYPLIFKKEKEQKDIRWDYHLKNQFMFQEDRRYIYILLKLLNYKKRLQKNQVSQLMKLWKYRIQHLLRFLKILIPKQVTFVKKIGKEIYVDLFVGGIRWMNHVALVKPIPSLNKIQSYIICSVT